MVNADKSDAILFRKIRRNHRLPLPPLMVTLDHVLIQWTGNFRSCPHNNKHVDKGRKDPGLLGPLLAPKTKKPFSYRFVELSWCRPQRPGGSHSAKPGGRNWNLCSGLEYNSICQTRGFLIKSQKQNQLISVWRTKLQEYELQTLQTTNDADIFIIQTTVEQNNPLTVLLLSSVDVDLAVLFIAFTSPAQDNLLLKPDRGKAKPIVWMQPRNASPLNTFCSYITCILDIWNLPISNKLKEL